MYQNQNLQQNQPMLNSQQLKKDFPILSRVINGKKLTYLDNASTSQKPQSVISAITDYYTNHNANIHRAVYTIAQEATLAYESTREAVKDFINARSAEEIIFTRNTTESINLVAYAYAATTLKPGDSVMVSALEHHSNLVPWQEVCRKTGATLKVIPLSGDPELRYTLDFEWFQKNIDASVKILAITQASNTTGTIVPVEKFIEVARAHGAKVLIDGAQSVPHMPVDVQQLDCDFLAFSSHKMLGPTGVGALYAKKELLETMPPFLFGGDMIREVHQQEATWNDLPWKFEAGTPNIADVIAFQEAIKYLRAIGMQEIAEHDQELAHYAKQQLEAIPQIIIHAPKNAKQMTGIISFEIPGVHPHDIAEIFNSDNIAIRGGHHCAQPLMETLNIPATARMSFYIYNTQEDIDTAIEAIKKVIKIFSPKK